MQNEAVMKISHPALKVFKCWVPQFCLFNFDFCILKLTNQFESVMQNKPNFRYTEMPVSLINTMTNNNEQRTMNYSKRTQSNPISEKPSVED